MHLSDIDGEQSPASGDQGLAILRAELMLFERHTYDLFKYKLFTIAVLGAVAVGVGPATGNAAFWVVALIPLISIVIDAAHVQADAAILTIARFLRQFPEERLGAYEHFVRRVRTVPDSSRTALLLHNFIMQSITVTFSLVVVGIGLWSLVGQGDVPPPQGMVILLSGITGVVVGLMLVRLRRVQRETLDRDHDSVSPAA